MRLLYRHLLRLHPPAFRERFELEMLLVFDAASTAHDRVWLMADVMLSLVRQWGFRPHSHKPELRQFSWVADGVPTFAMIEEARPRPLNFALGFVVSLVMFGGIVVDTRSSHAPVPTYGFANGVLNHSSWGWKLRNTTPLESPAGRRLAEWMDAYNSGEPEAMRIFARSISNPLNDPTIPKRNVDNWIGQFQRVGPLRLESLHQSQSDRVVAMARVRNGDWWWIRVRVSGDEANLVREVTFQSLIEPGLSTDTR